MRRSWDFAIQTIFTGVFEVNIRTRSIVGSALVLSTVLAACNDDPTDPDGNDQELITSVELTLTPVGGGAAIVSTINDPDGFGPQDPSDQDADIVLTPGVTYTGSVRFLDEQDPDDVEDVTEEVRDEDDEHRVFYTVFGGGAIEVPLGSLDLDRNGVPLGLTFQLVVGAGAAGDGQLRVLLSHFDDEPKGNGLTPSDETDADVTFDFSVT